MPWSWTWDSGHAVPLCGEYQELSMGLREFRAEAGSQRCPAVLVPHDSRTLRWHTDSTAVNRIEGKEVSLWPYDVGKPRAKLTDSSQTSDDL